MRPEVPEIIEVGYGEVVAIPHVMFELVAGVRGGGKSETFIVGYFAPISWKKNLLVVIARTVLAK